MIDLLAELSCTLRINAVASVEVCDPEHRCTDWGLSR
jgi:hypothetical protein